MMMKKKILAFLLLLAMLCGMLPTTALAAEEQIFSDVNNSSWYAGYVYALAREGLVNGITATTFAPQRSLTRAELVKLMVSAVVTEEEMGTVQPEVLFSDVGEKQWYAPYVYWCTERGLLKGYPDGTFKPNAPITRQEVATLVARFAEQFEKIRITPTLEKKLFTDDTAIGGWAKPSVYLCQTGGVIGGYPNGSFKPQNKMTRAEAVTLFCKLLKINPIPKDELPKPAFVAPTYFEKTVASVSVKGIEFDPTKGYTSGVVLADNQLYNTESAASIVARTGAYIAVDGAFFNSYTDLTTFSMLINQGEVLRIDNAHTPYKPVFVVDKNGKASIEFFSIRQNVSLVKGDKTIATFENVGCNFNVSATDGTRMIYTRLFGTTVPGTVARAAIVDENGIVTKVYKQATANVPIPEKGYVIFERVIRGEWPNFFDNCEVGDKLERTITYSGASTQDIVTALSCGPTVVKNGAAYGNTTTYNQEGFTEAKIVSGSSARMAIGVKADGTVVIASTSCTLQKLSQVMLGLGCQTAMNLDGGASCALYVDGKCIIPAGREMNNMLLFFAE